VSIASRSLARGRRGAIEGQEGRSLESACEGTVAMDVVDATSAVRFRRLSSAASLYSRCSVARLAGEESNSRVPFHCER
jgi:hypothetical protein